jgi:CBS domain-containing protein
LNLRDYFIKMPAPNRRAIAMTIRAILQTKGNDIISVSSETMLTDAVALLAEKRIGALPVIDGDKVVGIFSERDVLYGLAREGAELLTRTVRDVMVDTPITTTPESTALDALALMTRRRIRHLPVLDGETPVGFISIGDLVKHRIEMIESEAAALRDYITMS